MSFAQLVRCAGATIAAVLMAVPVRADGLVAELEKSAAHLEDGLVLAVPIYRGTISPQHTVRWRPSLTLPGCYAATMVGEATIEDLSLVVRIGERLLGSDRTSGKKPTARFCLDAPSEVTVELSAYQGEGVIAAGIYVQTAKKTATPSAEPDVLSIQIAQLAAQVCTTARPLAETWRGLIGTGKSAEKAFFLEPRQCLCVTAAANPPLRQLSVVASANGTIIPLTGLQGDSIAALSSPFCPKERTKITFTVSARGPVGSFAFRAWSAAEAAMPKKMPEGN